MTRPMLVIAGALVATAIGSGGLKGQTPPSVVVMKEVVRYVLNARRAGLNDDNIRRNAETIGWPDETIEAAIAYVDRTGKSGTSPAATETATSVRNASGEPSTVPAASSTAAPVRTVQNHAAPTAGPARGDSDNSRNRAVNEEYLIGAGDMLQISVWKEPDASVQSVVVRPDGKIGMPLLKEVEVAGKTPREVEKNITERLSTIISAPDVAVTVIQINSKKVFVVGGVKNEGPISYQYRMNVLQAISEAGGLTDYARRKKIYVLRTENGKDYRFPFNYDEVTKGVKMEQNIQLLPGDTLVVNQ